MEDEMKKKYDEILQKESLTPDEVFNHLKTNNEKITPDYLIALRQIISERVVVAKKLGQNNKVIKYLFYYEMIDREEKLSQYGINTYLSFKAVSDLVKKIPDNAVLLTDLGSYQRELPDDVEEKVLKLQKDNIFTHFWIVFTDYTGETRSKIVEENRKKDPILFGGYSDYVENIAVDRIYLIADWIDEHCHLTMDEFLDMSVKHRVKLGINQTQNVEMTADELKTLVSSVNLKPDESSPNTRIWVDPPSKIENGLEKRKISDIVRTTFTIKKNWGG